MNIDLHIHSFESKYKESNDIVDNSTIENLDVLFSKLNEFNVGLFSITDHNRFNVDLYNKVDEMLSKNKYQNVKNVLAGVEFDVKIDSDMNKCHIITIFDAKNKEENYKKINAVINNNLLKNKEDYYNKNEYEQILKSIGLDVILIACQRNSLDRDKGKHNSLSESTNRPLELISTGFISALEFQRPNVEGILKNNLKNIPNNIGLVMGSDCHDWNVYPNHDKKHGNSEFIHSRAKIMPTFKGLLMAITSPETRINQQESNNKDFIDEFNINDKKVKLQNGINAIIGENGSGKSTLLKLLNNDVKSPKYIKNLVENNKLHCDNILSSKKLYIGQGDIIKKFDNSTLFPKDNFKDVDHYIFQSSYIEYSNKLLKYIRHNIELEDSLKELEKDFLPYNAINNNSNYFVHISKDKDFSNIENQHEKPLDSIKSVLNIIKPLLQDPYFESYKSNLNEVLSLLEAIFCEINKNYLNKISEKNIKNIIVSEIEDYNLNIKNASSSIEKDKMDYNDKRKNFIDSIVSTIKKDIEENNFPEKPPIINGFSKKPNSGFNFNSESNYHGRDVHNEFLEYLFNQKYSNIEELKTIKDSETLVNAIRGCTSFDDIDTIYKSNFKKFIDKMCECKNYIVDISNGEKALGSTLGEQSLAYFKYITAYETKKCIFLIDQPEDHISNNNISNKLIKYLNSIRNQKQIIIVTHNPLLVVNLDVEQVIYVEKNNNHINVLSGCLELEDDSCNMLELIANNMDGGKSAIEKRLRVYG